MQSVSPKFLPARELEGFINAMYLYCYALGFGIVLGISLEKSRSIFAPAPLWNLSWTLLFLIGGILGKPYLYDFASTTFLFFLALSFNVVPILASGRTVIANDSHRKLIPEALVSPFWLLLATAFVGLIGAIHLSTVLGHSLLSVQSIATALNTGKENAIIVYRGEVARSAIDTVAFAVMQFGFATVGARLRLRPDRWTGLALILHLLSAVSWTTATTQRSYFLVSILWMIGGYIAASVATNNERVSGRNIGWAAIGTGTLVLFVVGARAIRVGGAGARLDASALSEARLWAAGYISTFSEWHHEGGVTVNYPLRLLSGALSLIGVDVDSGTRADADTFTYIGSGQFSNASTMMRAVVLTAGDLGAFLIIVSLGALSGYIYRRAQRGCPQSVALYAGIASIILWSVNAWHFTNGNRVLAQMIVCLALGMSVRLQARRVASRDSHQNKVRRRSLIPLHHARSRFVS